MASTPITSVSDFLASVTPKYFTEARGRWVFRGHSDKRYDLKPSVARGKHTSITRTKYERSLFDIFVREAGSHLSPLPSNEWEWLSIAQHHGLLRIPVIVTTDSGRS